MPLNDPHLSLPVHTKLQQWLKLYRKSPKKHSENCRNIKTLLHLHQQLTLYMYTWLSHGLGKLQNNLAVYVFTNNNLCLIFTFLCSTAQSHNTVNGNPTYWHRTGYWDEIYPPPCKFMVKF
jgi:hypothetical protein